MIRITNKTEYPTREVNRLVRKALGYVGAEDVAVTVKYRRRTRNDAYGSHTGGHYRSVWYPSRGETCEQILVTLPRPGIRVGRYHPYERLREQGRIIELADWREALVAVTAHEGMHHRQTPRHNYGNGKGHRYIEAECDLAAYRAVTYLREDERTMKCR